MASALTFRDPTSAAAAGVDGVALAPVCLDTIHRKIHQGEVFTASAPSVTKPDANSHFVAITVPAGVVAHVSLSVYVDGDCELQFNQNPGGLTGGNLLASINRNRASANTADITVVDVPEIFTTGFQLSRRLVPGGSPPSSNGQFSPAFEWICPEAEYLLNIRSSGAARTTAAQVFWYEEAA